MKAFCCILGGLVAWRLGFGRGADTCPVCPVLGGTVLRPDPLEHHLYPSVPFYHLPRLHQRLWQTSYPQEDAYCEPFGVSLKRLVGK